MEKLRLPLTAIACLLSLAVGIGGSYAVTRSKVDEHDSRLQKVESASQEQALAVQKLTDALSYIKESVDRIERKIR